MKIFKRTLKGTPAREPETNYSIRSEPPSIASQLDVERVFSVTSAAEAGHVRELFTLYRDMIISDSHTQGEIAKRKLAVLGDRMTVHPWDKKQPTDKAAADAVETMIHECTSWRNACIHLLDGALWPVSVVEKVFKPSSGGYKLDALVPVPHYLLDYSSGRMMINDVDPVSGTILPTSREPSPDRYIIHRGHLLSTPDNWGGPMRSILYWWLLGTMSRDWWARFLDRYGSPFIVGHYPSGDDKSRNVLKAAFSFATKLGGLVVTDKTRVEIIQAASASTGDAYDKFITICNREKSKLILGQTLSADAQPTGLGSGLSTMQEGVRQDIRMWDAATLADTLRLQLFDQYMEINGMYGMTPTLTWGSVSTSELKGKADMLVSLKAAGYRLTDDELGILSEEIGMSLERDPSAATGGGGMQPFLDAYTAERRRRP
jgi:phage gp29-like protein